MTPDSPLRRWRRKHRLTQAAVAERCEVTPTTVARWEKAERRGGRKPAGDALVRLIALTHLPAEALILPERYLTEHSTFLSPWALSGQGRGRPPRLLEEGEGRSAS
jgi:transcriptional regulator with XRE-family HTH domain